MNKCYIQRALFNSTMPLLLVHKKKNALPLNSKSQYYHSNFPEKGFPNEAEDHKKDRPARPFYQPRMPQKPC
jgi:hypothetical protein